MIQNFMLLLFLVQLAHTASQLNSNNLVNARIQCEYKDLDGESLILNCTLTNGLTSSSLLNSNVNTLGGASANDLNSDLLAQANSGGQQTVSNSLNIKVGSDHNWRTPWESLSINHNIITSLIWRKSRLNDLGEWAFKDLNYLQRIDLSHNKLQHISSAPFNRFELNLIELDLSHNLFQQIPVDLFQSKRVQSLEILRFNENPVVHLHRKPFESIRSSLKTLELNYCQIRSIDLNTFDDMKQLESVSLIGNHLRYLNEYTFRDLSLRSFYLHDNPLVCDCHMRWLINYLKNVDYQQQAYESQVALTNQMQSSNTQRNLLVIENGNSNYNSYVPTLSVASAAQQLLKCDQPNSLKSKPNFLDINPDSFMCEVQISLRDSKTEGFHELGDDAVLTCDVYGDPEPNVYWSFGQKPIEKALNNEDDKYYVHETRSYPMSPYKASQILTASTMNTNKTSQLKIKNLQTFDMGVYICTAEISGSNNRKQIKYNLKQLKSSLSPGLVVNSVQNFLTSASSILFSNNNSKPLSNWTLLLLLAILISLILFILMLTSFICWRCKRSTKKKELLSKQLMRKTKEDEKLLMSNQSNSVVDGRLHHNQSKLLQAHQINTEYAAQNPQMSNNSSATLIGNNNSSIRMAYPNQGQHLNDIYANHSLLTTTSTTTGSYLANNPNSQAIAIDTSNQTPRYHLLNMPPQHNGAVESYYDDLRYNNVNLTDENLIGMHQQQGLAIYSSPYKQQQYSPLVRRDDPTVPLYATLKPKLHQHRPHQYSNYSSSNSYLPYTTIQRAVPHTNNNTPPLQVSRTKLLQQHLPPPPPPPPPIKPKRTFEYVIGSASRDLHSESGAFLLASDDYDQANELLVCAPQTQQQANESAKRTKHKLVNEGEQGSTTSLDEEDLDLNDLKDFEDVTFDNLRKPGEQQQQQQTNRQQKNVIMSGNSQGSTSNSSSNQAITNDDLNNINNNTNSEQSLLLKSSVSSSENNNNDESNNLNNKTKSDLKKSNNTQTTLVNQYETNSASTDLNCNSEELNSKIYEETEI